MSEQATNPKSGFFIHAIIALVVIALSFILTLAIVPHWLSGIYIMLLSVLSIAYFFKMLNVGKYLFIVLLATVPFWAFALAQDAFTTFPFVKDLSDKYGMVQVLAIIKVASPSLLSIIAIGYWYLTRFQEISRTAFLPIILIVHMATIGLVILNENMTEIVMAWAMGSVSLTLFLNGITAVDKKEMINKMALFAVTCSVVLFIFAS